MFKNVIIATLLMLLLTQVECYAQIISPVTFVCLVLVLFVVLTAVEDKIEQFKRRRYEKRRFRRQLERAETCRKE